MLSNRHRQSLRNLRRKEAIARNNAWAALSCEEQLADLDRRLGEGQGAVKQRAKIARLIAQREIAGKRNKKKKK